MTTMDDLERLLERQYRFLEKQVGIRLVRRAKLFMDFIAGNPLLNAIVTDLVRETDQAIHELEAFDSSLLPELISYRHELADQAPEYDDSQERRPDPGKGSTIDYEHSFAFFDAYVEGIDKPAGIPLMPNPNDDNTKFKKLIWIVRGKTHDLVNGYDPTTHAIDPEKKRDDLLPLLEKLRALEANHDHQYRIFLDRKFSHAGPAWHTLLAIFGEVNPRPENYWELSQDERNYRLARALHGPGQILNKALYDTSSLSSDEQEQLERAAAFMKEQCERVYEEVMLRIGTRRSHQALIDRYKYRCEWHEQTSLRRMVQASSTPEDDLARHLALWLFDQGLNPMTKMRAGNLEPDLLDPVSSMSLYVEAKQYKDAHDTRAYLIKGIGQMVDTMARLDGTPYQVREGYYVVYRRGGPRYVFPAILKCGSFTIYPMLIDIAEAQESGSRQKHKPIIISEDELAESSIGL